ncbi:type-F conjugative transfer system pilin assembly protein TrbC [Serratia liquefaciens]|jgi:conjugal transfer pilus assembly protein TrbC|uniref:type-F conjugative transfer system pilin assembly protein TrbC n=1 Tax=Serratia liquefaciens TaxID=614 RepID=UPI00301D14AB
MNMHINNALLLTAMLGCLSASVSATHVANTTAADVAAQGNDNRDWLREQEKRSFDLHKNTATPAFLHNAPPRASALDDQGFIDQLVEKRRQAAANSQPAENALYFVSFSIPPEGLKLMLQETRRFGIPATVRGLINNNLRETVQRVQALVQGGGADGVQIDPMPFREYGIAAVPVLVVRCEKGLDVVRGNLRIEEGLKRIAKEGDCAAMAKKLLEQGAVK